MIQKILLTAFAALTMCAAANAQTVGTVNDYYMDYRVHVRKAMGSGHFVKYDTNQPIQNFSQVNIQTRAFRSRDEADAWLADRPGYDVIERGWCGLPSPDFVTVGEFNTLEEAEAMEDYLRVENGWSTTIDIEPFWNPPTFYSYGFYGW